MIESSLGQHDYEEFIVVCFFGSKRDYLSRCIARAYRDFNRTMRGYGKHPLRQELDRQARSYLHILFTDLQDASIKTQEQFDRWHEQACTNLCHLYPRFEEFEFFIGQAQKWLNMIFKYIFTMGEQRISGYRSVYSFCHMPLDKYVIGNLRKQGFTLKPESWSRIKNYEEYLSYQKWIRNYCENTPPLDKEFHIWMASLPKN